MKNLWSVRPSFILSVTTALFLMIAVYMNIQVKDRYSSLLWSVTHPLSGQAHALATPPTPEQLERSALDKRRSRNEHMQAGISVVLLIAALFLILSKKYTAQNKH